MTIKHVVHDVPRTVSVTGKGSRMSCGVGMASMVRDSYGYRLVHSSPPGWDPYQFRILPVHAICLKSPTGKDIHDVWVVLYLLL